MKAADMTIFLALTPLYLSQLIYETDRWVNLTKLLAEDAQMKRLRKVVDWKNPVEKPAKRKKRAR
jgi:hypothetical protein